MKKTIAIIAISVLYFTQSATFAQHRGPDRERWEKFRTEKISFLTSSLELTPDEAEKFWPVYNQMEKEKWQMQEARSAMKNKVRKAKEELTEKQIIELTREYSGSMQKEAELYVNYNEKFLEILPPIKVLKLYQAENEFRMHMIKKYRDQHPGGKKPQ